MKVDYHEFREVFEYNGKKYRPTSHVSNALCEMIVWGKKKCTAMVRNVKITWK